MKSRLAILGACVVAVLAVLIVTGNAAVQVNDKADIALTVYVPCAAGGVGEIVDLSGSFHTLITYTINGNNVSGTYHFQPQGISGVGETTGDKYQATGVTSQSFKGSLQNGQYSSTYVNNFRIIGQGPGVNYLVHETLHFTINADGTQTVYHDNLSVECR